MFVADFDFCIEQAFNAGKITKAIAKQLNEADDVNTAIDNLVGTLTRQKREAAIQAARMAEGWEKIQSNPGGKYNGLMALLVRDIKGKSGYVNVDYLSKYYQGKYHSKLAEAFSAFRTKRLGFSQDEAGIEKLIRAVYGETVNDPEIQTFAKQWTSLTDEIIKDFNAKGGSITKSEDWLLPQNHNTRAIQNAGVDAWKKSIVNKLDRSMMKNDEGVLLDDQQLGEALDYVFESITTHGLNKAKDFSVPRLGTKLSRRGSERRFLHFKDADSWLNYQKEFGKGDIFTTLTDYVDTKAHDIALMEILGPSPDTTFNGLRNQVIKSSGMTEKQKSFSTAVFKVVSGKVNEGELTGLADFFQTTRNLIIASTLGRAFISSISDIGAQVITSKYNGIPAFKSLSRQLSLLNPANEKDRVFSVKLGLTAGAWLGRNNAANRYADVYGTGVSAKLSEGVMRASLLSPWTDAGRKGFGMEFSSFLADNFGKSFGGVDKNLKKAFETYGIGKKEWDIFRKTKTLNHDGAQYADMLQDGSVKFHQMVMSETDFAIPTPDARVQAITTGGTGRGTIAGQAWRSAMMFKSFPITMITTHFYRAAYQATTADKVAYMAMLAASTTILGGIAIQAKDITGGKKSRPINNPEFFVAAFQQGGGLGIFGDFLFSDVNRFGGSITETITGPTGEAFDTAVKFTLGNVREAIAGEETNILGESAQILKRYTPDIWQTQVFSDALFDQIEIMANPDAERRFRKIIRRRQKQYDQGYWWKPGEVLPEELK